MAKRDRPCERFALTPDTRFTGPKITLSAEDLTEGRERAIAEDGLEIDVAETAKVVEVDSKALSAV